MAFTRTIMNSTPPGLHRQRAYLSGVVDDMELADGFPVLDDHLQSSLPGLFVSGFPATRDSKTTS